MDAEVVVIGGGAAGLSAALVLGRARRRVVVFDEGAPSNAPAHAIGGLLGQPGTSPLELLRVGRQQLAELPSVEVRAARASAVTVDDDGVTVDGVRAKHLLLATGMHYAKPDLPGVDELWGDTVFHCPFCHGWEVAGRPLAVLAVGEHATMATQLLRGWSDDVVLLDRPVQRLRAEDGKLKAVVFADGTELERAALLVAAPLSQRSSLTQDLELEHGPQGTVVVDEWGATSRPGVWAAGDVCEPAPNVASAIHQGSRAAVGIVKSLLVAG